MDAQTPDKPKRTRQTQQPCWVSDKCDDYDRIIFQKSVCRDLATTKHTDDKHYCLLHLPTKEKDIEKFEQIFQDRLHEHDETIAKIEADFPDDKDKQVEAKREQDIDYDFRYVWFPSEVNLTKHNFKASAYFSSATFSASAYFSSATFSADADFRSAKFLETSQINFESTRFCSPVDFSQTEFDGYVEFNGNVFLNADKVQEVKEELKNEKIKDGQEAFLYLEKARLNKPERISFNSMLLRPSWFVGTDVRNLNFNDVEWLNLEIDIDKTGLNKEFDNLTKHEISQPKESLIKAMNQLGDNAEANQRFEEAKLFRKQSIALKNYKCYVADGIDESEKESVRKHVCQDYPVVNEDGGQYYCLWHNPDKNKAEIFKEEFDKRQINNHSNYDYTVFPIDVWFIFIVPESLYFKGATFQRKLTFAEADVHQLDLSETKFEKEAELNFSRSTFHNKVNLNKTIFDGRFNVYGWNEYIFFTKDGSLSMEEARFEKPNWVNFRSVRLLPEYFFDVDSSKFTFHDCKWNETDENKLALDKTKSYQIHKMYAQTCTHLALNYEENRHFEESSMFRYASMESKRYSFLTSEKKDWFNWFNRLLYWLYKWTSGYGESWNWAMGVLIGLLIGFGVLFSLPISKFDYGEKKFEQSTSETASNDERFRSMNFGEGIIHSLSVATFQRPEPKPADNLTKLFIVLEVIFAPLQAALLALAIRRKFMR